MNRPLQFSTFRGSSFPGMLVALCLASGVAIAQEKAPPAPPADHPTPVTNTTTAPVPPTATGTNAPAVAASPAAAPTHGSIADPRKDKMTFDSFQMIADRNIFDPNRRPQVKSGAGEVKPAPPKVDIVSLAGTLLSEEGRYAFFDSNDTEFRKAAKSGDQIAGYRLRDVRQDGVSLAHDDIITQLKIGEQLRREGEGSWKVTAGETFDSPTFSRPPGDESGSRHERSSNDDAEAKSKGSAESEGPSPALKALLEKARKEKDK